MSRYDMKGVAVIETWQKGSLLYLSYDELAIGQWLPYLGKEAVS